MRCPRPRPRGFSPPRSYVSAPRLPARMKNSLRPAQQMNFSINFVLTLRNKCCAARSAFGRRAGRSGAETEERGAAKWRGRGLGQRNINCQKFKKKLFPSPKPLRTKSTLHHWTCGAFGMRGRCRLSCHSQATACGRAPLPSCN